jgi:hypothetical protein
VWPRRSAMIAEVPINRPNKFSVSNQPMRSQGDQSGRHAKSAKNWATLKFAIVRANISGEMPLLLGNVGSAPAARSNRMTPPSRHSGRPQREEGSLRGRRPHPRPHSGAVFDRSRRLRAVGSALPACSSCSFRTDADVRKRGHSEVVGSRERRDRHRRFAISCRSYLRVSICNKNRPDSRVASIST